MCVCACACAYVRVSHGNNIIIAMYVICIHVCMSHVCIFVMCFALQIWRRTKKKSIYLSAMREKCSHFSFNHRRKLKYVM